MKPTTLTVHVLAVTSDARPISTFFIIPVETTTEELRRRLAQLASGWNGGPERHTPVVWIFVALNGGRREYRVSGSVVTEVL